MESGLALKIQSLTAEESNYLAQNAKDYAITNGLIIMPDKVSKSLMHAPFMLFPTPWPRTFYEQAKQVQRDFNLLIHNVCLDHEFIKTALQSTIKVDSFTRQIYEIYDTTRKEGTTQPISLGCVRSDYMLHCQSPDVTMENYLNENVTMKLAQIELNTIAVANVVFVQKLTGMASYMLGLVGHDIRVGSPQIPANCSCSGICEGLALAWELYGSESAVILMIVIDTEKNYTDHRAMEYYLHDRQPRVKMIRRSLTALTKCASLQNKKLIVDGYEVAVAYYRHGYSPSCYPTQEEWDIRLLVERSLAIKCPTAAIHLVGTKKMQQVFAQPGILERFIDDDCAVQRIRNTFVGLYSLDEECECGEVVSMALQNPDKFVLKPQREGGDNNIFGDAIRTTLQSKTPSERSEFILMDKLQPPSTKNYAVLPQSDEPILVDVTSELGIYGVFISYEDKLLVNREVGFMMASKDADTNEGRNVLLANIAFKYKDCPYLF